MNVRPSSCISGEITLPGDKSISHRAIMFAAMADGMSQLRNLGSGRDNASTLRVLRQLGVRAGMTAAGCLVRGRGLRGLREPDNVLNAGNSGTTMRIMSGVLAAQPFFSVCTGDRYLVRRPMKRIVSPLREMGARIWGARGDAYPPLAISGGTLRGITHSMTVASAQVKSCLLMAGMFADGQTTVVEPSLSRDHTERMMRHLGMPVTVDGLAVSIRGGCASFPAFEFDICGDVSSSAFFMVAAALKKGSCLRIRNLSLNPSRTGVIEVLRSMGADIATESQNERFGEPVGDVVVTGRGPLQGTVIRGDLIPRVIDEIPVLAVAAAFADGTTVIDDAGELRVKESDRIKTMVAELTRTGVNVTETENGMIITGGGKFRKATVKTYGDHRIAMAMFVFGICSEEGVEIDDTDAISISFPGFFETMRSVCS